MPHYTAIVSLLAVAFYFFVATRVAAARGRFGVKLPATTGHPDFERILYFTGYSSAVEKRLPGFVIQVVACALLFAGAVVGIVLRWPGA